MSDHPLLGPGIPFAEAFPEIAYVRVDVRMWELGKDPALERRWGYGAANLPGESIACVNEGCTRGGVAIGAALRGMIRDRKTLEETTTPCAGAFRSPDGKKFYGTCHKIFDVKIAIEYKALPA